jgi:hypothetical protein
MTSAIIAALAKALPSVGRAIKEQTNPDFLSTYADLSAVIDAIRPVADHGIWFRQQTVPVEGNRAAVQTFYIHTSGEELSAGITDAPVSKNDAQGYGSALTYCRRYGLMAAFGIAPEDDDGNAAVKAAPAKQAAGARSTPPPIDLAAFCERWRGYLAQCVDRAALEKLWHETKAERAAVKAADAKASAAIVEAFKARTAELSGNHQTPISAG